MAKDSDDFKSTFKKLMEKMTDLVTKTPDQELETIGINVLQASKLPKPEEVGIICEDSEEFLDGVSKIITGHTQSRAYILQHPDTMSPAEINEHRDRAKSAGRLLIIPSVVTPIAPRSEERRFTPYILFYTHDKKLFMLPYFQEFFSDSGTEFDQ